MGIRNTGCDIKTPIGTIQHGEEYKLPSYTIKIEWK